MSQKIKLGKRKIKNKLKLFGAAIEISSDPFSKLSEITLKGNKEAIIDGCFGIIEYTDCFISINIQNGELRIIGCELDILDYTDTNITVCGTIKNMEFC